VYVSRDRVCCKEPSCLSKLEHLVTRSSAKYVLERRSADKPGADMPDYVRGQM
jgi:hypothetical protein